MPIYEYACEACGHEIAYLVRNGDAPTCPECEQSSVTKRFSVPAAHTGGKSLPVCDMPPQSGCGLPQFGMGGCQMM